jgi:protease-4
MKFLRRMIVLALIAIGLAWWLSPGEVEVAPGSVLVLDVHGTYVEGAESPLVARLLGAAPRPLASLLSDLAKAERDARLAGVVLRIRGLEIGWAKAQEIRDAIARLGERGRRTVAVLDLESFGANLELYVASAAQELYVTPATRAPLVGLAGEYFFLGGLFEKLGIEFEVERIGEFKTAADTITGRAMSDAHREMAGSLLDSIDAQFVAGLAASRELSPAAVRAAIDAAPGEPSELAAHGLIDGELALRDAVARIGDGPVVEGRVYRGVTPESVGFAPVAKLAIVYGAGGVVQGEGFASPTGSPVLASGTVSKALGDAADDPEVKALVLRIDSPGGSALASDEVWLAARHARGQGKPLVASFSDVAASGGYYVAAGADAILASPATITGSIGVFALRPVMGGALDALDIGTDALTRGAHADLQLLSRPLGPGSRERLRAQVGSIYRLFVERVAKGRPLDEPAVDAIARGRVWTGAQAAERGLVDELGGLRAAIERAKALAGIDADADVALVVYPKRRTLAEQIGDLLQQTALRAQPATPWSDALAHMEPWLDAARGRAAVALLPFQVEIR